MREGRCCLVAKHNAAPQLWISRVDADARQLSNGNAIKIYNERGEFEAKRGQSREGSLTRSALL
jgi:anaerobic selenocysteine-containing dehydrogenase